MDERIQMVREHYDANAHKEWERLNGNPYEFILTTWMMEKYIRPGQSILDIGGGPGRYAIHFAQMGCEVVLADLSGGNIALARQKAQEAGVEIQTVECNCLELDRLKLGQFDHVFLMGPLYHLQQEEQRAQAVQVALDHLKPGGLFYASFILAFAGVIYNLQHAGFLEGDMANPDSARLIHRPGFYLGVLPSPESDSALHGAVSAGKAALLWSGGYSGAQPARSGGAYARGAGMLAGRGQKAA